MIGSRLGPYEITGKLGEGGMGEVWRATDTRLKREVAIKVLPPAFVSDRERLARFEREAQLLAQLHHPNIASIFGLEESGGTKALVMELVEGEDLAARITRGAIPVDEAMPIARQIAEALEAAHEQGIVHRDLKPANVKLRSDGVVKVLDFGLAKAMDPPSGSSASPSQLERSPTLTMGETAQGVILGTAAYMAPEQARGMAVDRRADIWAYGVVLHEMLTGKRLFTGASVADIHARVLQGEIDFSALPAPVPAPIRSLLRCCLQRNTRNRLHDIADARIALDEVLSGKSLESASLAANAAPSRSGSRRAAPVVAAVLLVALGAGAGQILRHPAPSPSASTTRLSIRLPSELPFRIDSYPGCGIAISRDGANVAYIAPSGELVVRALAEIAPRRVSKERLRAGQPFFSPDGAWIGYFSDDSIRKIPVEGGRSVVLASGVANASFVRGSWSDDGRIVFDTWNAGLRVISADGGAVRVLTDPKEEWHLGPEVIAGTDTVLFFVQSAASFRIDAIGLDGGGRRMVLDNASQPRVLASGHLLFQRDGGLFVVPFDARTATVTGAAMPLVLDAMADDVRVASPIPQLAVSTNGTLAYAPKQPGAAPESELVWVDRQGRIEPLATVPFPIPSFDLSPDERHLALAGRLGNLARLAVLDLARSSLTPLRDERLDVPTGPVYSADGREIYFARYDTHGGEVLAQGIEGGEPRALGRFEGTWIAPYSASADGRWLVGVVYDPKTESDLWYIDLQASDSAVAVRSIAADGPQVGPALSPDGRWLAYVATETGAPEVFLQRFPGGESKTRVSSVGGTMPRWSRDGRELFYFQSEADTSLLAVAVETEPKLVLGASRKLFGGAFWATWDVGPSFAVAGDGKRFLMARRAANEKQSDELVVVQNWFTEVGRLFPSNPR